MDIDPSALICNGCWKGLSDVAYKTTCSHLFCRPCAESYFSQSGLCPLCDARLGGEGDIVELQGDKSPAGCLRAFSLAAFHPETAQRLLTDALSFARAQTALYGTREVWVKGQEGDGLKRRLVEAENRLHTLVSVFAVCENTSVLHALTPNLPTPRGPTQVGELSSSAGVVADLQDRLAVKTKELAAQKSERKRLEEAYSRATGGRGGALLLATGTASPLGEGGFFGGGGGGGGSSGHAGGHTVVVMPSASLGRRESVSSSRGGFPQGGNPAAAAATAAAAGRFAGASLLRPITPLTGSGFRSGASGFARSGSGGGVGGGGGGSAAQPPFFPTSGGWGGATGGR